MDVPQATISVAVMDAGGKLIMECLLETKAATIVEFIRGLARNCVADLRGRHVRCMFARGSNSVEFHDKYVRTRLTIVVCA